MIDYPILDDVEKHSVAIGAALREAGISSKLVGAIRTKALRTGRKVTGEFATNRDPRWTLDPVHPQYGTEIDSKIVFVKLAAQIFCLSVVRRFGTFWGVIFWRIGLVCLIDIMRLTCGVSSADIRLSVA